MQRQSMGAAQGAAAKPQHCTSSRSLRHCCSSCLASPDTPTQVRPKVSPANKKSDVLGGSGSQVGLKLLAKGDRSHMELRAPPGIECLQMAGRRPGKWSDLIPTASPQPQLHSSRALQPPRNIHTALYHTAEQRRQYPQKFSRPLCHCLQCNPTVS